jgi:predicted O-methyltransferase YrrM
VDRSLGELLAELEEFGAATDASTDDRAGRMLNITHDTGVFLALLVKATGSRSVLEIGTSNGYSTLWLADAVGADGTVTTVEKAEYKIGLARENVRRAGLENRVRQVHGDAGEVLAGADDGAFDLVFLDSDRASYLGWLPELRRVLAPGRLLVVDNAVSHAHEMEDFTRAIDAAQGWLASLSPIGKGELVVLKEHPSAG